MSGEAFGKYRLERRLAFGGMAEIFLASLNGQDGFEKRVVLKRILPQFGTDPTFVQMFKDEAVVAGRLSHPNLVQVYDFGDVDGVYFMAMEYVDGADLRRLLRGATEQGRRLSFAEVAAIGEGICKGLSYAHNFVDARVGPLNIVHRDISPHNVMVSKSGDVKVMDFGIAKAAARATHTATGMIKGKVAYMAPEQAGGKAIDKRCDQFALGVVLWECLTGKRLFEGGSDLEMLRKVMACETQPVSSLRKDVPEELEAIVMRALAATEIDRYDDLRDMEAALTDFRFSLGKAGRVQLSTLVAELVQEAPVQRRTQPLAAEPSTRVEGPREAQTSQVGTAPLDGTPDDAPHEALEHATRAELARPSDDVEPRAAEVVAPRSKRGGVIAALALVGVLGGVAAWRLMPSTAPVAASQVQEVAPALVNVRLESEPAGARVRVDGMDTGLVTPAQVPGVRLGQALAVQLTLDGYDAWQENVLVREVDQAVRAKLVQAPRAIVATSIAPVPEEIRDASKPAKKAKEATRKAPAPAKIEGEGALSLRSAGVWVDVFLEGKKLGTTPLDKLVVPAGRLELRLVNREAGVNDVLVVDMPQGGEVRRTVTPQP